MGDEPRQLTVGSLFAGIGGFDLGLERAGMRVIWQSEIDPYACAVLRKHWPSVPNLGDIRNITCGSAARPDVLCGGFPCQDISNAGASQIERLGLDGERSGLWSEFARLIGELRPRHAIMENVAALLGRGLERVLGDLASLGYDAEWHCIPASAVGAPHIRDRIWIIAYPGGERCEGIGPGRDIGAANVPQSRRSTAGTLRTTPLFADTISRQLTQRRTVRRMGRQESIPGDAHWEIPSEPFICRGDDGFPRRVDRLRCLGNSLVPQIAEIIGRAIIESEAMTQPRDEGVCS